MIKAFIQFWRDVMDLFASTPLPPLAERLRPQKLSDVVGQQHLLAAGKPLHTAVQSGKPHSMLLWGPPEWAKPRWHAFLHKASKRNFCHCLLF